MKNRPKSQNGGHGKNSAESTPVSTTISNKKNVKVDTSDVFYSKHGDLICYIVTGLAFLMSFILFNPDVSVGGDDSTYLEAASFFANGKEFPTWHGPMYPMMLSLVIKIFGFNVVLFKILSVLFFTVSVYFIYRVLSQIASHTVALVSTVLSSISYMILVCASSTYSEPFFMMLQSLFFYMLFALWNKLSEWEALDSKLFLKKNIIWFSLLALLVFLMYQTRSLAIVVVPAVILLLVCLRKYKSAIVYGAASVLIHLANTIYRSVVWDTESVSFGKQLQANFLVDPYHPDLGYETLGGYFDRLWVNSEFYLSKHLMKLCGFWGYHENIVSPFITVLVLLVLLLAGYYCFRHNRKLFCVFAYVAAMLGVSFVMLQTLWDQERLVLIYFPLILGFVFYPIYDLCKNRLRFLPKILVAVLLLSIGLQTMKTADWDISDNFDSGSYSSYSTDWRNYMMASKWAGENLPEGSVVICRKGQMSWIAANATDKVRFHSIYRLHYDDADSMRALFLDTLKGTHVIMANIRLDPYKPNDKTITTIRYSLRNITNKYTSILKLVKKFGTQEPAYLFEFDTTAANAVENMYNTLIVEPENCGAWSEIAMDLMDKNKHGEALQKLNEAMSLVTDENNRSYLEFYRGLSYCGLHQYEEALESFNQVLKMNPDVPEVLYNRAFCLYSLQRYPEALAALNKVPEGFSSATNAMRANIIKHLR
ncbi:MAG: tetratricopeptide repeat protein [Bacteroidales bacterium]|nr:tetratricopeptide repeat protein [Bacteroidales bacterium]